MQISYSVEDMMQLRKLIQLQLVSAYFVVNKKWLYAAHRAEVRSANGH